MLIKVVLVGALEQSRPVCDPIISGTVKGQAEVRLLLLPPPPPPPLCGRLDFFLRVYVSQQKMAAVKARGLS